MNVRAAGLAVVLASGGLLLAAVKGGVWQNKAFQDWTDEDARSILTDSPWAKPVPMPVSGRPGIVVIEPGANGATPPTASLGNPANTTSGTNMTNSGNPGSQGPAETGGLHNLPSTPTPSAISGNTGAPAGQAGVTIIWASAIPIRLAVLKLRSGANTPTEDEIQRVKHERPNYVIAVVGLPAPEGGSDPKALANDAFLTIRGKAPLMANDSSYRRIGNSDVYFFRFTRASLSISSTDEQVEFRMTMGRIELKRKFDLRGMQYQGQLTL